jgi:hypothetical protein
MPHAPATKIDTTPVSPQRRTGSIPVEPNAPFEFAR